MIHVSVQTDDFDVGAETARISADGAGAVASFVGYVRGDGGLCTMTLDHYPAMTDQALNDLAREAHTRWDLGGVTIIHRVGTLKPGAQIVLVATASRHRTNALEATTFLIDTLKTQAPFWKKECFADGRTQWVEARESDVSAAARWH
jgi:molybdopterin synthase catalytic subunit